MAHLTYIQAWRTYHQLTLEGLAEKSGLSPDLLADIEAGTCDPQASVISVLASSMEMPPGWLYGKPQDLELLLRHSDEDGAADQHEISAAKIDPVVDRMVRSVRTNRTVYALLTVLVQSGDERLIRAAEVSLRSLVKQLKPAEVPWASRQPGHFEPPSD